MLPCLSQVRHGDEAVMGVRGRRNISCKVTSHATSDISSIDELCDHECDGSREEEEGGERHELY